MLIMKTIKAYRIITGKSADSPRTVVFATDKTQAKLSAKKTIVTLLERRNIEISVFAQNICRYSPMPF